MECIIYVIKDPDTQEVRYVGKSTHGTQRWKEHTKPFALKLNNHKAKWLKKLITNNKPPLFEIIATANDDKELNVLEQHYIKYYRELGSNLTNHTDGGEGSAGRVLSEETRKKLADRRREWHKNLPYDFVPSNKSEHKIIGGIAHKYCPNCNTDKPITDFGSYKRNWDKLNHICKCCHNKRTNEHRNKKRTGI